VAHSLRSFALIDSFAAKQVEARQSCLFVNGRAPTPSYHAGLNVERMVSMRLSSMSSLVGVVVGGACVLASVTLRASDFVGVYAVVEKVVLEPSEAAPERVQIWGAFALSDRASGSAYGAAQRGYLYYACPAGREAVCRKEWSDLQSVAGKDTGVGLGARYKETGRVRKAGEAPAAPDPYPIERGVVRLSAGHDSLAVIERIKALLRTR